MLHIRRALSTTQQVIEELEDAVFSIFFIAKAKGMLPRLRKKCSEAWKDLCRKFLAVEIFPARRSRSSRAAGILERLGSSAGSGPALKNLFGCVFSPCFPRSWAKLGQGTSIPDQLPGCSAGCRLSRPALLSRMASVRSAFTTAWFQTV